MMRTFHIYCLSNFQLYNTVVLTPVTMVYITFPELTYLITGSLYLLTTFSHFPHPNPPPLATTNLFSVSMSSVVLDSTCKWDHTVLVFLWLISLSIRPHGPSKLLQMAGLPSFFYGRIIFQCVCVCVCVCVPHFLYPFNCWWTLRLFPCLGCHK